MDLAYNNEEDKALFGVFDGHGGREVAAYCGLHYGNILKNNQDCSPIDNTST